MLHLTSPKEVNFHEVDQVIDRAERKDHQPGNLCTPPHHTNQEWVAMDVQASCQRKYPYALLSP